MSKEKDLNQKLLEITTNRDEGKSFVVPNQRLIQPIMLSIPRYNEEPIQFKNFSDLIKLKGFLVKEENFQQLISKTLELSFINKETGSNLIYNISFSLLLTINSFFNYNSFSDEKIPSNYFITFPHNFFFRNFLLPIIKDSFFFELKLVDDYERDYDVKLIFDNYIISEEEKEKIRTNNNGNIKCTLRNLIQYKLLRNPEQENLSASILEQYSQYYNYQVSFNPLSPNFLSQGILLDIPKNIIVNISIQLDDFGYLLNYDSNLINIYAKNINDSTFISFNTSETFFSTNFIGCVDFSNIKNITISITLTQQQEKQTIFYSEEELEREKDKEKEDYLNIYIPYWNQIL